METKRNPQDSMKSTWRQLDRTQWTIFHWFYELLGIHPVTLDRQVPVHTKEDAVPHVSDWSMHRWILIHSAIPLLLHQLYTYYTGRNLGAIGAFLLYSAGFKFIAIHHLHVLRRLGHRYGFFDGDKHERDGVPDVGVAKVVRSLISTSTFRPIFTVFLAYRSTLAPDSMNWKWLPLEIGLYGIILDFWLVSLACTGHETNAYRSMILTWSQVLLVS